MPRIIRGQEPIARPTHFPGLVDELAQELKQSSGSGQPVIDEQHFPSTGRIRATVVWDKWNGVPHEERAEIILRAYEKAEGTETRQKIALAVGMTFLEALEAGMLPFQVTPLIRRGDPVSPEDCYQAMLDEGAFRLFPQGRPELRFATEEEAKASIKSLVKRLPGSEPVWAIARDLGRIEAVGEFDPLF
jgi:hypothetical protein